jgi:hypothetical protein
MKKHFLQFVVISGMFFFTACDSTAKENNPGSEPETKSTSVQTVDSVKKTTISAGPNGTDVKTKTTDVEVNSSGVKVGTKNVKVDIKTGK